MSYFKFFSTILLLLLSVAPAMSATPKDFQFQSKDTITTKQGVLYSFSLDAEILKNCLPHQQDLRLFDDKGTVVPHVLVNHIIPADPAAKITLVTESFSEGSNGVSLIVKQTGDLRALKTIHLNIADRNFRKEVLVEGSPDKLNWKFVMKSSIYDYSSQIALRDTKLEIPLSTFRWYRLTFTDQDAKSQQSFSLKFRDVDLSVNEMAGKRLQFQNIIGVSEKGGEAVKVRTSMVHEKPAITAEKDNISRIVLPAGLTVDHISLQIEDEWFRREVRIFSANSPDDKKRKLIGGDTIYRFPSDSNHLAKTEFTLHPAYGKFLILEIVNGDNPPLSVNKISFSWVEKRLFFLAKKISNVNLYCGNKQTKAPTFDLTHFIHQSNWYKKETTNITTPTLIARRDWQPAPDQSEKQKREQMILYLIIGLISVALGFWFFKLLGTPQPTTDDPPVPPVD